MAACRRLRGDLSELIAFPGYVLGATSETNTLGSMIEAPRMC